MKVYVHQYKCIRNMCAINKGFILECRAVLSREFDYHSLRPGLLTDHPHTMEPVQTIHLPHPPLSNKYQQRERFCACFGYVATCSCREGSLPAGLCNNVILEGL